MMHVRFWGVRGSIPAPGRDTVGIGGNTSCVELRFKEKIFILDCGTGLRALGNSLMAEQPFKAHIFLSHYHWDHIQGFPFFTPAIFPENELHVHGPTNHSATAHELLAEQMTSPHFPITLDLYASALHFHDIDERTKLNVDEVQVTTLPVYHPNGAYAYRFDYQGMSLVYATDTEHKGNEYPPGLEDLCKDANMLIYDSQYTPEEYAGETGSPSRKGWGHSTMMHGAELAKRSGVEMLVLFHHDPLHSDAEVRGIEKRAQAIFPASVAGFEGLHITKEDATKPLVFVSEKTSPVPLPSSAEAEVALLQKLLADMAGIDLSEGLPAALKKLADWCGADAHVLLGASEVAGRPGFVPLHIEKEEGVCYLSEEVMKEHYPTLLTGEITSLPCKDEEITSGFFHLPEESTSLLFHPLQDEGHIFGFIALSSAHSENAFEPMHLHVAGIFSHYVSQRIAQQNRELHFNEKLSRLKEELEILNLLSQELSEEHDIDKLLQRVVTRGRDLTGSDAASLYLKLPDSQQNEGVLEFKVAQNDSVPFTGKTGLKVDAKSIAGYVAQTGSMIKIDNAYELSEDLPYRFNSYFDKAHNYKTTSMMVAPIVNFRNEVIGVLQLINRKKTEGKPLSGENVSEEVLPYDQSCVEVVKSLSTIAAGALEKAMLIREMKGAMEKLHHTQGQLIQQEKMASLGTMATGVAHELNQPLTSIHLISQLMERKLEKGEPLDEEMLRDFFSQVGDHTSRMSKIIDQLLSYSRTKEHQISCKHVLISEVIQKALVLTHYQLSRSHIEVAFHDSAVPLEAYLDADKLQQVFINLLMNARDAMEKSDVKKIDISVKKTDDNMAQIDFTDTGKGMTEEELAHLFTPFYTTKPTGKGTGLGLFISFVIIEQHGGSMQTESKVGEGTTFRITLPLDAEQVAPKMLFS